MRIRARTLAPVAAAVVGASCSAPAGAGDVAAAGRFTTAGDSSGPGPAADGAGIDSLNAALARAYRTRDPAAYAALFTDSAVFEWPDGLTVRGPAALGAMARDIFAPIRDVDLRVTAASRQVAGPWAAEFGAFAQAYRDSAGVRRTEYGRYAAHLVRGPRGWRFQRWLGFADSTRPAPNNVR